MHPKTNNLKRCCFGTSALAWCAGLFDGEGNISIQSRKPKKTYHAQIRVTLTCPKTLAHFQKILGGKTYLYKTKTLTGRKVYAWSASGPLASQILTKLLPYLVTKQPEAEVLIAFQQYKRDIFPTRPYTPTQIREQEKFAKSLLALRAKGKSQETGR